MAQKDTLSIYLLGQNVKIPLLFFLFGVNL